MGYNIIYCQNVKHFITFSLFSLLLSFFPMKFSRFFFLLLFLLFIYNYYHFSNDVNQFKYYYSYNDRGEEEMKDFVGNGSSCDYPSFSYSYIKNEYQSEYELLMAQAQLSKTKKTLHFL